MQRDPQAQSRQIEYNPYSVAVAAALACPLWPGPCSARSAAGRRLGKGTFTQAPFERIADGVCPVWLMPAIFPKRLNPPCPKSAYADTPAVRTSAEMATVLRHPSILGDAALRLAYCRQMFRRRVFFRFRQHGWSGPAERVHQRLVRNLFLRKGSPFLRGSWFPAGTRQPVPGWLNRGRRWPISGLLNWRRRWPVSGLLNRARRGAIPGRLARGRAGLCPAGTPGGAGGLTSIGPAGAGAGPSSASLPENAASSRSRRLRA